MSDETTTTETTSTEVAPVVVTASPAPSVDVALPPENAGSVSQVSQLNTAVHTNKDDTTHYRINLWLSTFEKKVQNGIDGAIIDAGKAVKAFEDFFHPKA